MFYNLEFSFWYLVYGAGLTYVVWGFIVAFEVVLAMNGTRFAREWLKKHHTYKQLYYEVKVFYPMICLGYLFLEILPHLFWRAPKAEFAMQRLFDELYSEGA